MSSQLPVLDRTPGASTGHRPSRRLPLAGAALLPFLLIGLVRMGSFAEGDTFWAVPTGAQVVGARSVSLPDLWSWTIPGRLWHPNAWLYDVLLHLADAAGGRVGLGIAALLGVLVSGVGVAVAGRVLDASPGALLVTGILGSLVLVPWLSARPQTVSYGLLLITVALAARVVWWRGRHLVAGTTALAVLSASWVNLHLAGLSGVMATTAGLTVLLAVRRHQWRQLVPPATLAVTATVLGCLASPLGWSVFSSALATRDASSDLIKEWAPLWRAPVLCQITWLAAAAGLGLTLLAWRRAPQHVVLPIWSGASATLLVLGVGAARFSPMAALLTLPAAAVWMAGTDWRAHQHRRTLRFLAPRVAAAIGVAYLVLAAIQLPHVGEPSGAIASRALVEAIPAGCRVLNEYDDGGWITYLRSGDGVRVAMDGRNDAFGVGVIEEVLSLLDGRPGALAYLEQHDVGCLLVSPDRPIVAQAEAAGWHVAATGGDRVLLLSPVP